MAAPRRHHASSKHGFTLLETVLVLVLITMTLALAAPSLGGWRRGAMLRDAGDDFLATAAWARARAIADARIHQLQIDPAGAGWRVLMDDGGQYVPAPGEYGQGLQLPPSLRIDQTGGGASIAFHPNGRTTAAAVRIATLDGRHGIELRCDAPAESFRLIEEASW